MWKGAKLASALFLLTACAANEELRKAQMDEAAKAAAEAVSVPATAVPVVLPVRLTKRTVRGRPSW